MIANLKKELLSEIQNLDITSAFYGCSDIIKLCIGYLFESDILLIFYSKVISFPRSVVINAFSELLKFGSPVAIVKFNDHPIFKKNYSMCYEDIIKNIMFCFGDKCDLCSMKIDVLLDKINVVPIIYPQWATHNNAYAIDYIKLLIQNLCNFKKSWDQGRRDSQFLLNYGSNLPMFVIWGHEKIFSFLMSCFGFQIKFEIDDAILSGNINIINKYLEMGANLDIKQTYGALEEDFIELCCRHGYLDVLQYIFKRFPKHIDAVEVKHIKTAMKYGQVNILKYFFDFLFPKKRDVIMEIKGLNINDLSDVFKYDQVDIIEYIVAEKKNKQSEGSNKRKRGYGENLNMYDNLLKKTVKYRAINICTHLLKDKSTYLYIENLLKFELHVRKMGYPYLYFVNNLYKKRLNPAPLTILNGNDRNDDDNDSDSNRDSSGDSDNDNDSDSDNGSNSDYDIGNSNLRCNEDNHDNNHENYNNDECENNKDNHNNNREIYNNHKSYNNSSHDSDECENNEDSKYNKDEKNGENNGDYEINDDDFIIIPDNKEIIQLMVNSETETDDSRKIPKEKKYNFNAVAQYISVIYGFQSESFDFSNKYKNKKVQRLFGRNKLRYNKFEFPEMYCNEIVKCLLKHKILFLKMVKNHDYRRIIYLLDIEISLTKKIIAIGLINDNTKLISQLAIFLLNNDYGESYYEAIIKYFINKKNFKILADLFCCNRNNKKILRKLISDDSLFYKIMAIKNAKLYKRVIRLKIAL